MTWEDQLAALGQEATRIWERRPLTDGEVQSYKERARVTGAPEGALATFAEGLLMLQNPNPFAR